MALIREYPLLAADTFMVKALLDDRQTEYRQVLNPQPEIVRNLLWCPANGYFRSAAEYAAVLSRFAPDAVIGNRLWLRETWAEKKGEDGRKTTVYQTDEWKGPILSRHWRPITAMPRWASRITLEVIGFKVERLQEITNEGAIAEGFASRDLFAMFWDRRNRKAGFPWGSNPWVGVTAWRRVK